MAGLGMLTMAANSGSCYSLLDQLFSNITYNTAYQSPIELPRWNKNIFDLLIYHSNGVRSIKSDNNSQIIF